MSERRRTDRRTADQPVSLRRSNMRLRRAGLGMLVAWAFVATLGVGTLALQTRQDNRAVTRAAHAVALSAHAVVLSHTAISHDEAALSKAVQANQLTQALAAERTAAIIRGCQAQNRAHDATILELDRLLGKARRRLPASQRRQLAQSRQFTVLLIDRLDPKQPNCNVVAARANRP